MADLGLIGSPNGQAESSYWVIKYPTIWQNDGTSTPIYTPKTNGQAEGSYWAIKIAGLWQNNGVGAYVASANAVSETSYWAIKIAGLWQNNGVGAYVASTNGQSEASYPNVPWYSFIYPTIELQGADNCNGSIYGHITSGGLPVFAGRVQLQNGWGLLVEATMTNAAGFYRFDGLPIVYTDFTIIVPDPTNTFNLGRLDNMTPV